jgi:hypothetical protein
MQGYFYPLRFQFLLSIVCSVVAFNSLVAQAEPSVDSAPQASRVKEILRLRCQICHSRLELPEPQSGLDILDFSSVNNYLAAGNPAESELFRRISLEDESRMPPPGHPPLSTTEREEIRTWIQQGPTPFPADEQIPKLLKTTGNEYVLQHILQHVRAARDEDRPFLRFFSTAHLLARGTTAAELQVHEQALAKAINHLSWEREVHVPKAVDDERTIFAIDIRKLGWHRPLLSDQASGRGLNAFDLILLENPYGLVASHSKTQSQLITEWLSETGSIRPVAFIRVDWFVSVATQSPLYEDILQLPLTVEELEKLLGIDAAANLAAGIVQRAAMVVSGVSRNIRIVERQPLPVSARFPKGGYYWKSYDFSSSRGSDNAFRNPIDLHPAGGEIIFSLPNGTQGYFLANGVGRRVTSAPTTIVTDRFADDRTVRNGLACMRCHDRGMKNFVDTVRPAFESVIGNPGVSREQVLKLYPSAAVWPDILKADSDRFLQAMEEILGQPQSVEPLIATSRRYLEGTLDAASVVAELGLADGEALQPAFRTAPLATFGLAALANRGVIKRDTWEELFAQLVETLRLGTADPGVDSLVVRDVLPATLSAFDLELTTDQGRTVVTPGETISFVIRNRSPRPAFVQLLGVSAGGEIHVLEAPNIPIQPQAERRTSPMLVRPGKGGESVVLIASPQPLPAPRLFRNSHNARENDFLGPKATDRIVHDLFEVSPSGQSEVLGPVHKRTISLETQ